MKPKMMEYCIKQQRLMGVLEKVDLRINTVGSPEEVLSVLIRDNSHAEGLYSRCNCRGSGA